jgi:hypothetical protein
MHIRKTWAAALGLTAMLLAGIEAPGQHSGPPTAWTPQNQAPPTYYPAVFAPPQGYGPPPGDYVPPPTWIPEWPGEVPGNPGAYEPPGYGAMIFQPPPDVPPQVIGEILPPPAQLPVETEYTFFDAGYWFPTQGWSNSFEIGVNGSTGNAETFSMRTGAHIQRKEGRSDYTLDVKYAKTLASGLETQHNALVNSNVETDVGESLWTTFLKTSFEYDEFKAWNVRAAMNAGVGYHLVKADDGKLIMRFGSGVSREVGGPEDDYVPEAVYGLEFDRRITRRQKFYGTIEYFPDWTNYRDYRLVTNAGWEFVLDEESNLSLKLGAIDRYDSTPHGRKPNDLDYSLVLLWKQ